MGPIVAPRLVLRLVPRVVPFSATVALPFRCPKVVACGSLVWSSVWSPVWSSVWSQTGMQKGDHTRGPNGDQTYALQVTAFGKWIWTSRVRILGGGTHRLERQQASSTILAVGDHAASVLFWCPGRIRPKAKTRRAVEQGGRRFGAHWGGGEDGPAEVHDYGGQLLSLQQHKTLNTVFVECWWLLWNRLVVYTCSLLT